MLYQSNLFPEIQIHYKMTNSLFIAEKKDTRSKIIKPLPGIKTKKKLFFFIICMQSVEGVLSFQLCLCTTKIYSYKAGRTRGE